MARSADPRADLAAGRALRAGGFAAIDFETATGARSSACAVAIALIGDGEVQDVFSWLIRPPGNEYNPFNIRIHGITPEQTAGCPTLAEVWPQVAALIGRRPLVAHNAPFDLGVMRESLAISGARRRGLECYCTVQLARRAWPDLQCHKLDVVSAACGIELVHHDPGQDARAAGLIALACCGNQGKRELALAGAGLSVRPQRS